MAQPQTRMTRQRAVILEELRKVKTHPTADELYSIVRERLPRISLGTVYRNLDFLTESKEILKLESAGSIRRFDGDTRPIPARYAGSKRQGRQNGSMAIFPGISMCAASIAGA